MRKAVLDRSVWLNRTFKHFILINFIAFLGSSCTNQTHPERKLIIGFAQCTGGDAWRKSMQDGMDRELSFHPSVQLIRRDAQNNTTRQIAQIRELLKIGVDLLIVSPNEAEPLTPLVEEIFNRGIPVIILDRRTSSPFYTAYVGANNTEVGQNAARYIATSLNHKGNILEITGAPGASPAQDRHNGFLAGIAGKPDLNLVAQVNGNWEREYVLQRLPAVLRQHPETSIIFAHNDRMALGAYQVCKQLGLDKKIQLVGVDGLPGPSGGIQLVEDGVLKASVSYPTGGEEAIRTALKILHKEPFLKENLLETMVIQPENVHMLKLQTDKIINQQEDIRRQQVRLSEQTQLYNDQKIASYILITLLTVALLFGAIAFLALRSNRKINQALEQQNGEILLQRNQILDMAEQARESTEAKLRFFTNFSHELKTPLTLIIGPIEEMLTQSQALAKGQRTDLELIRKNAQKLLQLVNQLMDFRKIEVGKMPLQVAEYDLVWFIREIMQVFEKGARQRKINFQLLPAEPVLPVCFDANLLDKVFYNLLANAFKFTPDNGRITITIQQDKPGKSVRVKIEDNGQGIPVEEQKHIFEWFYQGQSATRRGGVGIGLALSQELVQLHQGSLNVTSKAGQGCLFELKLPVTQPASTDLTTTEVPQWEPVQLLEINAVQSEEGFEEAVDFSNSINETVLLIEDNTEIRKFLARKLRSHFIVLEAVDGVSGIRLAFEKLPDAIICDLVLPFTDGKEVISTLKTDWRTSHIPIILLTTSDSPQQQLQSIQTGADLYLPKPVNPAFIIESLRMLLRSRERYRDHFRREISLETATLSPQRTDRKFMDEMVATIETNLGNSDFAVDDLARELGVSRMQLYRKAKTLLDCSLTDFIQTIRLNKARQLLLNPSSSVATVAYEVGFSSPTYFATTFKQKFNLSPSEYKGLHTLNAN
jgi:signal transduction histidine kinase/DNA-binding response OmpR family regulator